MPEILSAQIIVLNALIRTLYQLFDANMDNVTKVEKLQEIYNRIELLKSEKKVLIDKSKTKNKTLRSGCYLELLQRVKQRILN